MPVLIQTLTNHVNHCIFMSSQSNRRSYEELPNRFWNHSALEFHVEKPQSMLSSFDPTGCLLILVHKVLGPQVGG